MKNKYGSKWRRGISTQRFSAAASPDHFVEDEAWGDSDLGKKVHNEREDVHHSGYPETDDSTEICELSETTAAASSRDLYVGEEAWDDSVKKCKHGKTEQAVDHSKYIETSDQNLETLIKEKIRAMFLDGDVYEGNLSVLLREEFTNIQERILMLKGPEQHLPGHLAIAVRVFTKPFLLDRYRQAIKICQQKLKDREAKAKHYFCKELGRVTKEIMRKIDGVVRV